MEKADPPKKKRTGGSNDPDWAKRIAGVKVSRDVVEKSSEGKTKESSGLKWSHVRHEKVHGRYVVALSMVLGTTMIADCYCSSLKKGVPMPALDEDDEEELPVVRVKKEQSVKIEEAVDVSMRDERNSSSP